MKSWCFWLALTLRLWAAPIDSFPADPPGLVRDRLYQTIILDHQEHCLYAVVVKPPDKKPPQVLIYSGKGVPAGMEWKLLYTWVLSDGGRELPLSKAVLQVGSNQPDQIQFYFQEWFRYVKGRAMPVLNYTPKTGKFESKLVD